MSLVWMVRHGEAELPGSGPDRDRRITPKGYQGICILQGVLDRTARPALLVVSDAVRSEDTGSALIGDLIRSVELPELRLMGIHEHKVTRDIMLAQGKGATFKTLLAADTQGLWMSHAQKVAQRLREIIAENKAYEVLVVGHETISTIGMALLGRQDELLLGQPFGYAGGFVIDTENNTVTRIAKDSP